MAQRVEILIEREPEGWRLTTTVDDDEDRMMVYGTLDDVVAEIAADSADWGAE